jgi:hypothetical protein
MNPLSKNTFFLIISASSAFANFYEDLLPAIECQASTVTVTVTAECNYPLPTDVPTVLPTGTEEPTETPSDFPLPTDEPTESIPAIEIKHISTPCDSPKYEESTETAPSNLFGSGSKMNSAVTVNAIMIGSLLFFA